MPVVARRIRAAIDSPRIGPMKRSEPAIARRSVPMHVPSIVIPAIRTARSLAITVAREPRAVKRVAAIVPAIGLSQCLAPLFSPRFGTEHVAAAAVPTFRTATGVATIFPWRFRPTHVATALIPPLRPATCFSTPLIPAVIAPAIARKVGPANFTMPLEPRLRTPVIPRPSTRRTAALPFVRPSGNKHAPRDDHLECEHNDGPQRLKSPKRLTERIHDLLLT